MPAKKHGSFNPRLTPVIIVLGITVVGLAIFAIMGLNTWDPSDKALFEESLNKGCVETNGEPFCTCIAEYIEGHYSFEQVANFMMYYNSTGIIPGEIGDAARFCVDKLPSE